MTKNELAYIAMFLEQLGDRFGNDGCNDMTIPDTPENRQLVSEAEIEFTEEDGTQMEINASDGAIHTGNHVILRCLQDKFMKEHGISEEDVTKRQKY